jgi:hypothetical protein
MVARGLTRATGKQPVGELLAIVGQNFLHLDWASLVQGVEKRAGGSGSLVALDLNEHPARGVLTQRFLHRLVAFEDFVRLAGFFGLERIEVT